MLLPWHRTVVSMVARMSCPKVDIASWDLYKLFAFVCNGNHKDACSRLVILMNTLHWKDLNILALQRAKC